MARRPARESGGPTEPAKTNREKIIDALMELLAEERIEDIGFGAIARRAGLTLADCRAEFRSVLAVLAAYTKEVDRQVLAGGDTDTAEEPPRERLFDVLMRRLEALAPHKAALRSLARSAARDPALAVALNGLTATVGTLNPMIRYLGPYVTVCNNFNYFWDEIQDLVSCAARGLRCSTPRCCAPGSTTTIPAWRAPWRRSIAALRAAPGGRACSTTCAGSCPPVAARPAAGRAGRATPASMKNRRRRSYTGTRTVTRRPPSGLSPNEISPPCERAMSRAMASPSPVPPSS